MSLASAAVLTWLLIGPCGPPTSVGARGCLELPTSAVVRVYDGDTLTLRVPGWPPLYSEIGVRLVGYDTPEIRGRCELESRLAVLAREALTGAIRGGRVVRLDDVRPGKYFRVLAVLSVDGVPVAERLTGAGLARAYDGGSREGWCGE